MLFGVAVPPLIIHWHEEIIPIYMILSILVDTFFSKISLTMLPVP